MSDRLLAVGMIVLGAGALAGAAHDWRGGKTYDAYGSFQRPERPFTYWALVVTWSAVSVILVVGGVMQLLR